MREDVEPGFKPAEAQGEGIVPYIVDALAAASDAEPPSVEFADDETLIGYTDPADGDAIA